MLFGAVGASVTEDGHYVDYTNSLYGVTPNSRDIYHYDKHHLVPFGEFIPWGFRWFVDLMKMPLGDFARGALVQKPFLVHNQPVMADICYEDLFGEEIAATIRDNPQPPGVLVNVTNLAWFGDTIALDQHLQIARMRSLETGRPMLRATNTGMTAAIDAHGRVLGQLKPFTIGSLDVRIEGTSGFTPYVTSGNNIVLAVSLVLLAFGFTFGPGYAGATARRTATTSRNDATADRRAVRGGRRRMQLAATCSGGPRPRNGRPLKPAGSTPPIEPAARRGAAGRGSPPPSPAPTRRTPVADTTSRSGTTGCPCVRAATASADSRRAAPRCARRAHPPGVRPTCTR